MGLKRRAVGVLLALLVTTIVLLPHLPSYAASELLANGGFESGLPPWQTYGGNLAQAASPVHSGSYAASFSSATTSTKWFYQDIAVSPGRAYTFSGWAVKNDPNVSSVYFRISFRSVSGGTQNELLTVDSAALTSDNPSYRSLTVSGTAPSQATLARAMTVLVPISSGAATVYVDDLSFTGEVDTPPATPTPAPPQPSTTLHVRAWAKGSGIDLLPGLPGAWDANGAGGPCVIKDGNTYKMWYTGRSGSTGLGTMAIGYTVSTDGINWNKAPPENPLGNPVLARGSAASFDASGVAFACVIKDGDGYKMWYTGYSGFSTGAVSKIGYATSADGVNWSKRGIALDVVPGGTWESMGVGAPCVIKDGSTYKMWYSGVKSALVPAVGYASSSDGVNWTRHIGNPVLSGSAGIAAPAVIKDSGIYRMWYTTYDSQGVYQISYASSTNGISWAKAAFPELRAELQWESSGVGSGCVINDSGSYKMWYAGVDGSTIARIGHALPGSYTTIQSAINAASPSGTVIVHPGTYTEQLTLNKEGLTIKSVDPAAVPVIDATGYSPAVTISASSVTFKGFHLTGGVDTGIRLTSGAGGAVITHNDILGNSPNGVVSESNSPTVVELNWWGHAAGPGGEGEGNGGAVRGAAPPSSWLTRDLLTTLQDRQGYRALAIPLDAGWNVISTPFALDSSADSWGQVVALGNGLKVHPTSPAYYFDASAQQWQQVTADFKLKPLEAVYVRMSEPDKMLLLASIGVSAPQRQLFSGWNLIGLSTDPAVDSFMWADVTLRDIASVYTRVVSPSSASTSWVYAPGDAMDKSSSRNPGSLWYGKGYWLFMKSAHTLTGSGATPLPSPIPTSW